jgi:hypothetical protein
MMSLILPLSDPRRVSIAITLNKVMHLTGVPFIQEVSFLTKFNKNLSTRCKIRWEVIFLMSKYVTKKKMGSENHWFT